MTTSLCDAAITKCLIAFATRTVNLVILSSLHAVTRDIATKMLNRDDPDSVRNEAAISCNVHGLAIAMLIL